jgi:4-hydroxyphenylpyruvate dioxygenase
MENNPIGIKAIDHLEFTADTLDTQTAKDFTRLGFTRTEIDEATSSELYTQGQIRFLLTANTDKESQSRKYFEKHNEGVSKIAFWVENAEAAIEEAIKRGATEVADLKITENENGVYKTAAIQGFGDVINEFVERPTSAFRPSFSKLAIDSRATPLNVRCSRIDHLTNNVPHGEMDHWVDFYKRIYGFVETRYFDIKGKKTGLQSKVVQSSNNQVIIPINEPEEENGKSQIQEFLDRHNGAGVQHIALMTPDIVGTISQLRERDIQFLKVPHTYYEDIPKRNLGVTEDLSVLEKNQILVDGDDEGYLLQIFSDTYVGPLFYEYIQRKNHWGFGEGNFQALFDAIERDQMERGYL